LPALALAGDAAVLTCIANDFGYNEAFSRQIRALGAPGDIAWALSTSGNSENVVDGLKVARENGLVTILMTGKGGGRASAHADLLLDVPSANTAHIQEIHMISYHAICSALERELFAEAEA
jgi:D-sedoheptulose 7-phosphate isomerase